MGKGTLFIISAPSGAGKTSLVSEILARMDNIRASVSHTTRACRPGEEDGVNYHFVSQEQFVRMVEGNAFLEHAEVFGNRYGSPKAPVSRAIDTGQDVLFDVDWQGGQQLRNSQLGKHALSIFILPPSIPELERRLQSRGQDSQEIINGRMAKSRDEISHWPEYDYVLINQDLDRTEQQLRTIIGAERLRLSQQPDIVETVRRLNAEFEERK